METGQEIESIAFWMWFTLLFVIGLIGLIIIITRIFYKNILLKEKKLNDSKLDHQKELLKTTILTQEKERERIAQDIHDGLVSKLNVIRLSKKEEKQVNAQIADCIKTVRLISHDLIPPLVEKTPINDLLHKVVTVLDNDTRTLETHYNISIPEKLSPDAKLQVIRIIQEVTTNVLKYADATQVRFLVRSTTQHLSIKIEDNGVGFDPTQSQGLGLKNITARVQLLQGSHKFKNMSKKGSIFLFSMPLDMTLTI